MSSHGLRVSLIRAWALAAAASVALVGCDEGSESGDDKSPVDATDSGSGTDPDGGAANKGFCDALAVVRKNCIDCHDGVGNGPMKLLTHADFLADAPITKGKKVWEQAKVRIHDEKKPMPPRGKLPADELATLDSWLSGGALPGADPTCPNIPAAPAPVEEVWPPPDAEKCEKIVAFGAKPGDGAKRAVLKGEEIHPQFVYDAPWGDQKVHAVGFKPLLDNKKILHHWILYPNANRGLEGMIIGWAPGGEKVRRPLPKDVGVIMPSGPQALRLDVHYFNVGDTAVDETDASGVEVCWTTKLRPQGAQIFMQFGSLRIDVPPNSEAEIMSSCTVQTTDNKPVYLLSTSPHAHTFARRMKFTVERMVGGMMTEIPMWEGNFVFDEQQAKYFDKPFELLPGDKVVTRCFYKNDTPNRVMWGEDTGNEMCFNYTIYYPVPNLSCAPGTGAYSTFGQP